MTSLRPHGCVFCSFSSDCLFRSVEVAHSVLVFTRFVGDKKKKISNGVPVETVLDGKGHGPLLTDGC